MAHRTSTGARHLFCISDGLMLPRDSIQPSAAAGAIHYAAAAFFEVAWWW